MEYEISVLALRDRFLPYSGVLNTMGGFNNQGEGGSENITDTNKWGWDGQLELQLEEIC